jgi:hypothetical protein
MSKLIEMLSGPFRIRRLKNQYRILHGLDRQEAERSLRRQMDHIRKRYPNKSERWCLEKIIYDLKRDRR